MVYQNNLDFAIAQDAADSLRKYRDQFYFPKLNHKKALYFTGNSLGLQPKTAQAAINIELEDWAEYGVEGHFEARNPWLSYHEPLSRPMAEIIGAKESEVVCMNTLTTNLHLLFVSFYRPTKKRYKIISESKMFPSDRYLLETQTRFHGFEPDDAIIEIEPRAGEYLIQHEDILAAIEKHKGELALVFFGAVNYFTGQLFDLAGLTKAAHQAGAIAGFDLAHAAGNVLLNLHKDQVDFAAWCSYKYLNSGPGNVGGLFVHENHGKAFDLPRFGGWWGHNKERRFLMENHFQPMSGAEGWQLSNAPVFGMAIKKASLDIFSSAGMKALRQKSLQLTGYLEFIFNTVLAEFDNVQLKLITPENPLQRGCQLSIKLIGTDKSFFNALMQQGVLTDFREPDVIRMAPTPLYNSFEDVYQFGQILKVILQSEGQSS